MQVTLDVKELLGKIRQLNPESDLRGLKAWLFDLVFEEVSENPGSVSQQVNEPIHTTLAKAVERLEEKNQQSQELVNEVPAAIIGDERPAKPTSQIVVTGAKILKDRDRKRHERREDSKSFLDLSSKDMINKLTDDLVSKKERQGNQYTNEGEEGPPKSKDDLEIG